MDCSHYVVFTVPRDPGPDLVDAFAERTTEVRATAPESMDGFRRMAKGFFEGQDSGARLAWARNQVYLALGQFMSTAACLGVDTCPMEGFSPPDYDRILGLTDQGLAAVVCCAVGYRSDGDKYASLAKVRFSREQMVERRE